MTTAGCIVLAKIGRTVIPSCRAKCDPTRSTKVLRTLARIEPGRGAIRIVDVGIPSRGLPSPFPIADFLVARESSADGAPIRAPVYSG